MKSHRPPSQTPAPVTATPGPSTGPTEGNQAAAEQITTPAEEGSLLLGDEASTAGYTFPVPESFLAPDVGADASVNEGAPGKVETPNGGEANAMWRARKDIAFNLVERPDGRFAMNVARWDLLVEWHMSSTAEWSAIEDFPGGAYDPTFNTEQGTRIHEEAEIRLVIAAWNRVETAARAFAGKSFATIPEMEAAFKSDVATAMNTYEADVKAIGTHANPIGPQAEWAYYTKVAGAAATGEPE